MRPRSLLRHTLTLAAALTYAVAAGAHPLPTPVLSDQERADLAYVVGQMTDLETFWLDLSDERQYRVFRKQLELAGESPERSPQLFRSLEEQRRRHLAGGFEPPAADDDDPPLDRGFLVPRDALSSITVLNSDGGRNYYSTAFSAVEDGSLSLTMTLGLYNAGNHQLIGNPINGGGTDGSPYYEVQAAGYSQNEAVYGLLTGFYVDNGGVYHGPYAMQLNADDALPVVTNLDPSSPSDDPEVPIVLCVTRCPNNSNHCQYPQEATCPPPAGEILLNVQGSVDYPDPIDVDGEGNPLSPQLTLLLVDTRTGSGCQTFFGPDATTFFNNESTVLSNDNKTLSWNLDPGDFAGSTDCLRMGDLLNYTFVLQLYSNDQPTVISVTSSPPQEPGTSAIRISQMSVFNGCLPPGTLIEMADGSMKKIEDFEAEGERVRTGSGAVMTVLGNITGSEDKPLIHVADSLGHRLALTETHPVITEEDGVQLARELAVGDRVLTEGGPAVLTMVEPRTYSGPVYNLELGVPGEERSKDNTTMFANGILVGDSRMQDAYARERRERPVDRLSVLPPEWHQDYLNELAERHPRAAAGRAGTREER